MKKILSILFVLFSVYSFGQNAFPNNPTQSNINTNNQFIGAATFQRGMVGGVFADTTSANAASWVSGTRGIIIYSILDDAYYFRSGTLNKWVQFLPSGGTGGLGAWTTTLNTAIPTDISLNGYFGTTANNGIGFYTNNTQRVILPSGGLALSSSISDTTANKIMVYNPTTKVWGYSYWFGGGGGGTGTVTSVGLTVPSPSSPAFSVSGSPVTGSGTLAISANGTTNQYVRGDGSLQTFPTIPGTVVVRDSVSALAPILYNSSTGVFSADTSTANTGLTTLYQNGLKADKVTTMSAGFGLLGGGSLASNRTFDADSTVLATHWYVDSSIVAYTPTTPTWQQTLTAGSTLNQTNEVFGTGVNFDFTDFLGFAIGATDIGINAVDQVRLSGDTITLAPGQGKLYIDTLTNSVGTKALRYNPTTGLVSYADTTSGGGGDGIYGGSGTLPSAVTVTLAGNDFIMSDATNGDMLSILPSEFKTQIRGYDGTAETYIQTLADLGGGNVKFLLHSEDGTNTVEIEGNASDGYLTLDAAGGIRLYGSTGINTTPDASAALDISSTEKGFLVPRMTETERDAIGSPATGLLIYQTDGTDGFYYYDGAAWTAIGGSSGANTALSNLASVAINTSLISDADNTDDLGSAANGWKDIYSRTLKLDGSSSGTATITAPAAAGTPTITLPIVTGTLVQYVSNSITSSAAPSPTGDARVNDYYITALAAGATFAAPSGTPVNGNELFIYVVDNGGAQTLAWNAIYGGSTDIALPNTTTAGKGMAIKFKYVSSISTAKWIMTGLTNGFTN